MYFPTGLKSFEIKMVGVVGACVGVDVGDDVGVEIGAHVTSQHVVAQLLNTKFRTYVSLE